MRTHLRIARSAARTLVHAAPIAVLTLAVPACERARYIETGSPEGIISVGEVDMQDILRASSGMLESLIETGVLKTAKNKPAELVIDQVVNDTSSRFSVDELTYRMREQLVNSGQAAVVTTYGQTPEDKTAQDLLRRQAFLKGERASQMPDPDFSLSGKITQVKRTAGDTKQVSYTFRLTLTNIRTGLESWTKTVSMTKVGNKPAVGF
jgi:PBP1b-binding outer membrane lipoprotein LpoB